MYTEERCSMYAYTGVLISGLILFYWIYSIRNCECVNKKYINIIQKTFLFSIILYIIECSLRNKRIGIGYMLLLSVIMIVVSIYFLYNVRLLINDIYKKKCLCADTNMTYFMSVINYIKIFSYIFSLCFAVFFIITFTKILYNNNKLNITKNITKKYKKYNKKYKK